jgi:hypothetical protein
VRPKKQNFEREAKDERSGKFQRSPVRLKTDKKKAGVY